MRRKLRPVFSWFICTAGRSKVKALAGTCSADDAGTGAFNKGCSKLFCNDARAVIDKPERLPVTLAAFAAGRGLICASGIRAFAVGGGFLPCTVIAEYPLNLGRPVNSVNEYGPGQAPRISAIDAALVSPAADKLHRVCKYRRMEGDRYLQILH